MRMSEFFFKTRREVPADAEVRSHQLMLRAGLIHQAASGIFSYLPLGLRVKRKLESIMREEMDAIGGQEVSMPMVQPAELWQKTGRWQGVGSEMMRMLDAGGRPLCLGMTHEEVVTDLVAANVESYKRLPFMLYQIQNKFRDEARPRAGLIRAREFTMKDGYSFHTTSEDLDGYYERVYEAYFNIFNRAGLDCIAVASDTGMMGGSLAHEYMALTEIGEDTLLICDGCGYQANRQVAQFDKGKSSSTQGEPQADGPQPLEAVETPGTSTIEDLANFLKISKAQTAKAVFLMAGLGSEAAAKLGVDARAADPEQASNSESPMTSGTIAARDQIEVLVFAVLRGDMDLSETKLSNAIGANELRPARAEEIEAVGAIPGYASPVGLPDTSTPYIVVADDQIPVSCNLAAGANRDGYHYLGVNYARDWKADLVLDIAAASDGDACPQCAKPMRSVRGVEVGNIFKLGTKYSSAMGAAFADEQGQSHPMHMGCYGIGSGRLIATLIEQNCDDAGIVWPATVAPFDIHLVGLGGAKQPETLAATDRLYESLCDAGLDVLYDDRKERAGVKFNDADLLGIPLRLTLGSRGVDAGTVEYKVRSSGDSGEIRLTDPIASIETFPDLKPLLKRGFQ